ncbi:hypothetical protein [Deinococcus sp.]|uniref:hypothetical protein n=1 Tax=Deinococcus sp. TaxID=47478 RepID=UPI003B5930AC
MTLAFQGDKAFSLAVESQAELIRDKGQMKEHWTSDLNQGFKDDVDTDGIVT